MANLNLDNLTFDFEKMSAQDVWDFEEQTGGMDLQKFAEDLKAGKVNEQNFLQNLKPVIALVWVIVRQKNPKVTFADVAAHPMMPMFEAVVAVTRKQPERLEPLPPNKSAKTRNRAAATT